MSCPVAAVVPAGKSLFGIVGDLISVIPVFRKELFSEMIDLPVFFLGRQVRQLPGIIHSRKWCPLFDDQTVRRDMFRPQFHCGTQCPRPALHRLPGKRRHQVEIDVVKSRFACRAEDLSCLISRMDPAKKL